MARIAPFAFLLVAAFRCHGDSKSGTPTNGAVATSGSPGASASNAASAALPPDDIFHKDPCRYVSQAETEAYLGPLLHTPYRGTDDRITADSNGRFCLYRGKDGRSIVVSAEWLDGAKEMKQYTQGFLSKIFVDDKGKTDTLSDVWDEAAIRDGTLFALKADTMFAIAYGASKADLVGATKLAEDAIGRLGKPLAYNGATAAAGVPGPLVAARDACTVLTRKEVEAVMGPLTADPTSEGTVCHYPTSLGMINLTVAWTGGFQAIFSDRGAMNNAHAMINQQFFNLDTGMKKMHEGLQKKMAPGTQLPSATDSTIAGPWDDSRLAGLDGSFTVVKKDVYMQLPLIRKQGAAVALLTTAMNKIQ